MKHITFYLDFISPYAYLAFERMPEVLQGLSYQVTYKPVLFAALLKHHGQLGPAEIEPKRNWTYRQVQWLAHDYGIEMQLPAAHPFNPLSLLRLAVASNADGFPNRYVTETIFHHVWHGGRNAEDAARLHALTELLKLALDKDLDSNSSVIKDKLKANTQEAIDNGVFGVPTLEVDGKFFFGLDALPMLAAYLKGDAWFQGSHWDSLAALPKGSVRTQT